MAFLSYQLRARFFSSVTWVVFIKAKTSSSCKQRIKRWHPYQILQSQVQGFFLHSTAVWINGCHLFIHLKSLTCNKWLFYSLYKLNDTFVCPLTDSKLEFECIINKVHNLNPLNYIYLFELFWIHKSFLLPVKMYSLNF